MVIVFYLSQLLTIAKIIDTIRGVECEETASKRLEGKVPHPFVVSSRKLYLLSAPINNIRIRKNKASSFNLTLI